MKIYIGEDDKKSQEIAQKHHFTKTQSKAFEITERALHFKKIQTMNRDKEEQVFEENEKVIERVVMSTIFQTLVILATGIFQIFTLRRFFIEKRLY